MKDLITTTNKNALTYHQSLCSFVMKAVLALVITGITTGFTSCLSPAEIIMINNGAKATRIAKESNSVADFEQSDQSQPQPNSKLSPEEVIGIQLQALKNNDTPTKDAGIATAFRFASPSNKEATGPLDNFIKLVKNPAYRPLIDHQRAERRTIRTSGDQAQQRVLVIDTEGSRVAYVFTLTKQRTEPYKDCWMTDGVVRAPDEEQQQNQRIAATNGHFPTKG